MMSRSLNAGCCCCVQWQYNYFISCHTHPQWGSPYCGKIPCKGMLATFLFQMSNQNFTVLIFFFLSSSSIQMTNKKSFTLCFVARYIVTLATDNRQQQQRKEGGKRGVLTPLERIPATDNNNKEKKKRMLTRIHN